jgi:hypothetical protein
VFVAKKNVTKSAVLPANLRGAPKSSHNIGKEDLIPSNERIPRNEVQINEADASIRE